MTVPPHDAEPPTGAALDALRETVAGLPAVDEHDEHDEPFDAADHATRFEAVHDALVAVLTDVDRT